MATTSHRTDNSSIQTGFTLLETLVVLIIGVIILAGAAAGISKLFSESQISVEARNLTQLQRNIQAMRRHDGYADLDNTAAYQFGAVPANMAVSLLHPGDYDIKNSWGGHVTILDDSADYDINNPPANARPPSLFTIDYEAVPQAACQQLILKMVYSGWIAISVLGPQKAIYFNSTGTDVTYEGTAYPAKKPDLPSVQQACVGSNNSLKFIGT